MIFPMLPPSGDRLASPYQCVYPLTSNSMRPVHLGVRIRSRADTQPVRAPHPVRPVGWGSLSFSMGGSGSSVSFKIPFIRR